MAEHRDFLLGLSDADRVLFLDDDILLEPDAVARLLEVMDATGAGVVGMAMQGLSYVGDVRPHEHVAYEEWDGPVEPERVRKETPGWERWRLHNAANLVHLDRELGPHPRGWRAYKIAWAAGCVLFDRAALRRGGRVRVLARPAGRVGGRGRRRAAAGAGAPRRSGGAPVGRVAPGAADERGRPAGGRVRGGAGGPAGARGLMRRRRAYAGSHHDLISCVRWPARDGARCAQLTFAIRSWCADGARTATATTT